MLLIQYHDHRPEPALKDSNLSWLFASYIPISYSLLKWSRESSPYWKTTRFTPSLSETPRYHNPTNVFQHPPAPMYSKIATQNRSLWPYPSSSPRMDSSKAATFYTPLIRTCQSPVAHTQNRLSPRNTTIRSQRSRRIFCENLAFYTFGPDIAKMNLALILRKWASVSFRWWWLVENQSLYCEVVGGRSVRNGRRNLRGRLSACWESSIPASAS